MFKKIMVFILVVPLLISGFSTPQISAQSTQSTEAYIKGSFRTGARLPKLLNGSLQTLSFSDGRIMVYEKASVNPETITLYNPATNKWTELKQKLYIDNAILLSDGRILIVEKKAVGEFVIYILDKKYTLKKVKTLTSEPMALISRTSVNASNLSAVEERDGEVLFFASINVLGDFFGDRFYVPKNFVQSIRLNLDTFEWDFSEIPDGEITTYFKNTDSVQVNADEYLLWTNKKGLLYNAVTKTWKAVSKTPFSWYSLSFAGVLPDNKVLFAGGWLTSQEHVEESYIYDVSRDTWKRVKDLPMPMSSYSSIVLPEGDVMLVGGISNEKKYGTHYLKSTYVYKRDKNTWIKGPTLQLERDFSKAILTKNGSIIVLGTFFESSLQKKDFLNATEVLILGK